MDSDSPVSSTFSVGFRDGTSEADTGIWQGVRTPNKTPVLWAYLTVSIKDPTYKSDLLRNRVSLFCSAAKKNSMCFSFAFAEAWDHILFAP